MISVIACLALGLAAGAFVGAMLADRRQSLARAATDDRVRDLELTLTHHLNTNARWHG